MILRLLKGAVALITALTALVIALNQLRSAWRLLRREVDKLSQVKNAPGTDDQVPESEPGAGSSRAAKRQRR